MWFIVVVLLITVILNSVNGEKEMDNEEIRDQERNRVVHPAEYLMRKRTQQNWRILCAEGGI